MSPFHFSEQVIFLFDPQASQFLARTVQAALYSAHRKVQGFGNFLIDISELEVNEKVGEGGYGVVYRGKWLGQDVAIKYGFFE